MAEYEQITLILDKTSHILVSWLEKALLELSPKWWEYRVVAKLSFTQSNRVRNIEGINSFF